MATEKRLIDANEAKAALTGWETEPTDEEIEYVIDEIPTVDAVEVVRCKDCKHRYTMSSGMSFCKKNFLMDAKDNDFCSYGEGRTDV